MVRIISPPLERGGLHETGPAVERALRAAMAGAQIRRAWLLCSAAACGWLQRERARFAATQRPWRTAHASKVVARRPANHAGRVAVPHWAIRMHTIIYRVRQLRAASLAACVGVGIASLPGQARQRHARGGAGDKGRSRVLLTMRRCCLSSRMPRRCQHPHARHIPEGRERVSRCHRRAAADLCLS